MLNKYAVLIGIIIAIILMVMATRVYPGGSLFDNHSIGFDWTKNFISNLFGAKAVNGVNNPARIWADAGLIMLAVSFALFFVHFSEKIPAKGGAKIIKKVAVSNVIFTSLIVTPLHDLMVPVASTLFLVSLFYVTISILKSRLYLFKLLCIFCLLLFYYTFYLYGSSNWAWLSIVQKITFSSAIILILGLEYFTKKEDFEFIKPIKP